MKVQQANELTWEEIAALRENVWWILPVSSLEQHGVHLPVGTDDLILDYVLQIIKDAGWNLEAELVLLPSIKYGCSVEHMAFPGTITLGVNTMLAVVEDIVASLSRHGFKKLVVLNGHGGNTAILRALGPTLKYKYNMDVYNLDLWASSFFAEVDCADPKTDIHGGDIETSILKMIAPHLVKDQRPAEELKAVIELNEYDFSWQSQQLSKYGVMGDALAASEEKGRKLANYIGNRLKKAFEAIVQAGL